MLFFISCDKEYSAVGDALIGENNFELAKYTSKVVAHNEKITPVESNNLAINALGIYDNPAFGKTTAHFATQLTLATVNPTIGPNPVIDSVYIDVPYFSTKTATDVNGKSTYELDSIYGKQDAKIKLSIYESGRYMGTQSGIPQIFYTDQNAEFDDKKTGNRLNNDSDKSQNDEFFFNSKENKTTTKDASSKETITRTPPSMRLRLDKDFFYSKMFQAPAGSLASNDFFVNYFKGLYFKVEQSGADKGSLALINFAKGTITIKYKEDTSASDKTRVEKSLVLNMSGSTASLLEQSNTKTDYETATSNPNRVIGDEKLYLKGGEGSLAVIDLFGPDLDNNKVPDELEKIRKEGWLINEANLVFYIDAASMKDSYEPNRIFLYDYTNSTPILDFFVDPTQGKDAKTSKVIFDGIMNKDAVTKKGSNYKIRITNHIRNLVKSSESKNVKLGVVVTESIEIVNFNKLKNSLAFVKEVPKASVMNPLGTILHGSNSTDESKRLKLEIYYTKPK